MGSTRIDEIPYDLLFEFDWCYYVLDDVWVVPLFKIYDASTS